MPEPPLHSPFTLTGAHFSAEENYVRASNEKLIWLWTPHSTNLIWQGRSLPISENQLLTWHDLISAHYFPRLLSGEPCCIQNNALLPAQPEKPWHCSNCPPA